MRASIEVADIFRAAGPAYRAARARHLSLDQLKVMSATSTEARILAQPLGALASIAVIASLSNGLVTLRSTRVATCV